MRSLCDEATTLKYNISNVYSTTSIARYLCTLNNYYSSTPTAYLIEYVEVTGTVVWAGTYWFLTDGPGYPLLN